MVYYAESAFPPGHRLAWERDGSGVYSYKYNGDPNHPTDAQKIAMNDESSGSFISYKYLAVLLPVPVQLVGVYAAVTDSTYMDHIETSPDTTDGLDGTWTEATAVVTNTQDILGTYRSLIEQVNVANVKGIRIRNDRGFDSGGDGVRALHIYVAAQETYLKVWHPTLDQEIVPEDFDWGVVYAGETYTRQFRIKNVRAMTANSVEVTNLTHTNVTIDTAYDFSLDGVTFSRPLNIGNIAAGAMSSVITQRLILPEAQAVTTYATQISAIPASWTA